MNREQQRFQAAVAAMHAMLTDDGWLGSITETAKQFGDHTEVHIAQTSVGFADALIAELDRTKPETETPKPDAGGWIPHRPGDPIPCDEGAMCYRKYRNGKTGIRGIAGDFSWGEWGGGEHEIIAWKPA